MLNAENYSFCQEFDVVEKSIEVQVMIGSHSERIRIEALRERSGAYSTRARIQKVIRVQSGAEEVSAPVWAFYSLPWTKGNSADEVLSSALGWLEEHCSKN